MGVELTDDQYVDLVRRARRQGGGFFWTVFGLILMGLLVLLTLDHFGKLPPELVEKIVGKPQAVFSTPVPAPGLPAPVIRENPPPPVPTPPQPAIMAAPDSPTPTATPQPTATPDPTDMTRLTAIAIRFAPTETAMAVEWKAIEGPYFYDPYTLATPGAGFQGYVERECSKGVQSWFLEQMCQEGE